MKKIIIAPILVLAFLLMAMPMSNVLAGDGATGSVDFDQTSVAEDTLVYVHFKDLTVSADYMVSTDNNVTQFSFTTGSSQTDIYVPVKFTMPADGNNDYVLTLHSGTGAVAIDSITVYVTEASTILDDAAFLTIAVPLIVIALIVSIVVGISAKKR